MTWTGGSVRVGIVAPGEVDPDIDREEEERQRRGAMHVPRRRPRQRDVDADAVDPDAEYLHRELRGDLGDEVEGRELDQRIES